LKGAVGLPRTETGRWAVVRRRGVWALPYAIGLAWVAITLATPHDDVLHRVSNAVTRVVLEFLALAFSVVAARHPDLDWRQRRPWRYISYGLIALLVSEIIDTASVVNPEVGSSIALMLISAVTRLLFFAGLLRGLFLFAGPRRRSATQRWRVVLDSVTVVGGSGMWMWYFVFGPALPKLTSAPRVKGVDLSNRAAGPRRCAAATSPASARPWTSPSPGWPLN
jgi:hypothetical protein